MSGAAARTGDLRKKEENNMKIGSARNPLEKMEILKYINRRDNESILWRQ